MVQNERGDEIVAASGSSDGKKLNLFQRIALFIRQVFTELSKVVTPTRQELLKFTAVVLGFVVVMMALVWGLDLFFVWIVEIVFGIPN